MTLPGGAASRATSPGHECAGTDAGYTTTVGGLVAVAWATGQAARLIKLTVYDAAVAQIRNINSGKAHSRALARKPVPARILRSIAVLLPSRRRTRVARASLRATRR